MEGFFHDRRRFRGLSEGAKTAPFSEDLIVTLTLIIRTRKIE